MLTPDSLRIEIRDADLDYLAPAWPLSLVWRRAWCAPGGWEIELPWDATAAEALRTPGAGIAVYDAADRTLFSGPAHVADRGTRTAWTRTRRAVDGVAVDVMRVAGLDDLGSILAETLVIPPPGDAYDVRTGAASSVILGFVSAACGPSAPAGFERPELTLATDPVVGGTVTGRGRFHLLADLLPDLAVEGGVSFDAVQDGTSVEFAVDVTTDRSADVVFSIEDHTVQDAEIAWTATGATDMWVAGQGEGAARDVVELSVAVTPARRIARFVDARDLATTAELSARGAVRLQEAAGGVSVAAELVDDDATAMLDRDYRLGDFVGLDLDGERLTVRVAAVETTVTADAVSRRVTIGTDAPTGAVARASTAAAQAARIRDLERR